MQDLELYLRVSAADGGEVLQDELGALRLARPGLATDNHALVLPDKKKSPKPFIALLYFVLFMML